MKLKFGLCLHLCTDTHVHVYMPIGGTPLKKVCSVRIRMHIACAFLNLKKYDCVCMCTQPICKHM